MRRKYQRLLCSLLVSLLFLPMGGMAQEQDEMLKLTIRREFGYGGGTRIQGRFSMRASGPESLKRVEFLIDEQVVNDDLEAPFRYDFSTGDYPPGVHALSAIGYAADGRILRAPTWSFEFVTAEQARLDVMKILGPLMAVVIGFILLGTLGISMLGRRTKVFRRGQYGAAGGAVCPGCKLPFSRHLFAPNLLLGKLERCPHCGKWSIVGMASRDALEEAEARLMNDNEHGRLKTEVDEEQRLRRLLDESRFDL